MTADLFLLACIICVFYISIPITLRVPTGTRTKYEAASVWKDFREIMEFDTNAILAPSQQPAIVTMCGGEVTVKVAR